MLNVFGNSLIYTCWRLGHTEHIGSNKYYCQGFDHIVFNLSCLWNNYYDPVWKLVEIYLSEGVPVHNGIGQHQSLTLNRYNWILEICYRCIHNQYDRHIFNHCSLKIWGYTWDYFTALSLNSFNFAFD